MKKMLRTLFCLLPIVALCFLVLAGCNRSGDSEEPTDPAGVVDPSEEITGGVLPLEPEPVTLPPGTAVPPASSASEPEATLPPVVAADPEPEPQEPAPPTGEPLVNDPSAAAELLLAIAGEREAAGAAAPTANAALDKMALAYAEAYYGGGPEFYNDSNYETLPSGEPVYSLLAASGYEGAAANFGYSLWKNQVQQGDTALADLIETVKASTLYQTRAVEGDYTDIGIACATSAGEKNPFTVVIMVYLDSTPPAE